MTQLNNFTHKKLARHIIKIWFIVSIAILINFICNLDVYGEATSHVRLHGADKITARISTFTLAVNEQTKFGSLIIDLYHCDRALPQEIPESRAFLQIREDVRGLQIKNLFSGWMFASSPALNALEHPVYDIWVDECINLE
ncbi:MAG: DUF2155 domain-containing protein [Pseudomonadota bacterium]